VVFFLRKTGFLAYRRLEGGRVTVPDTRVGHCLGPEGNGVGSGEGGEGGPGPPSKEGDKQSNPSKEGGNMEQEEEGRKSQA
jgi:hypothetical protein